MASTRVTGPQEQRKIDIILSVALPAGKLQENLYRRDARIAVSKAEGPGQHLPDLSGFTREGHCYGCGLGGCDLATCGAGRKPGQLVRNQPEELVFQGQVAGVGDAQGQGQ